MYVEENGFVTNRKQLFSIRRLTQSEGRGRGAQLIEVRTAGGLSVDILPDAGLDIGQVFYRGINMTFLCKNGYDSPAAIMPYETEFTNTFPGGLLYTCGLRSAGPQNRDGDEWQPLHGRYHSLCAENVCCEEKDGFLRVSGVMRETQLFGHLLEVKREITLSAFGSDITVHDVLTNLTVRPEEYMQIYHCNFGYPMLSDKARLILPEKRRTTPRTPFAATALGQETTFTRPVPNEEERVFFHEDMEHTLSLVNPEIGVRMDMEWSASLPVLAEWRMMGSGEYALGLEPTNCYIMGRSAERENGSLRTLGAFESIENEVRFRFGEYRED